MEDCYFIIEDDPDISDKDRRIRALCVECQEKKPSEGAWFHPGSEEGYGPFDFQCCRCQKFIHKAENDETETSD